jgi:hypothetical protein
MKCIIFFIILISLIYLNYNLKFTENFVDDVSCNVGENSFKCKLWNGTQCRKVLGENKLGTCSNFKFDVENQRTKCLKYCETPTETTASGTSKTLEATTMEATVDNIHDIIINNKTIKLHNIPIDNQNLNPYLDTSGEEGTCVSNSDCEGDNICGGGDDCGGCLSNKCYKIIETNMYNLESNNSSYIEVPEIDSLDIHFRFYAVLSTNNNNQMIVRSGLNEWYIYINSDNKIMLNGKEIGEHIINTDITKDPELYTFIIKVTRDYINININGDMEDKIYKYKQDYDDSSDVIYFGGLPMFDIDIEYFDGHIGGFFFEDTNTKLCTFKYNKEGIKKECLSECKKDGCNTFDCDDICKDNKICNFDSSKNVSRHAIDCMTKCIHPDNSCDINYCKKQCWNCGPDCYWIKNNKFSEEYDDDSGKPYPAKISLHSTSYDGTKAKIVWEPPNEGKFNLPIDGYFSIAYKTQKKSEGLKIDKIDSGICEKYCNYVVSNLIPEEDYSLVIRAYNKAGIGRSSNLIQFKTTKKLINTEILNKIEDATQYEVGHYSNDNFCNIR